MLSPSVTAQLIAAVTRDGAEPEAHERARAARAALAGLTERERDVAEGIARGRSNAEIAAELFMGVPTVKTHVGRLFTKLGVENRVQVAILVHDAQA
jgi:DNA-binding NarL/FixJ family response regulator